MGDWGSSRAAGARCTPEARTSLGAASDEVGEYWGEVGEYEDRDGDCASLEQLRLGERLKLLLLARCSLSTGLRLALRPLRLRLRLRLQLRLRLRRSQEGCSSARWSLGSRLPVNFLRHAMNARRCSLWAKSAAMYWAMRCALQTASSMSGCEGSSCCGRSTSSAACAAHAGDCQQGVHLCSWAEPWTATKSTGKIVVSQKL